MTHLEQIAAFVCGSTMASMSALHRDRLRLHVVDAGVALMAGAHSPDGARLRELGNGTTSAQSAGFAAALAAAIIRSTETDDIHIASCVTPTSIALPAALLTGPLSAGAAENALRIAVELAVRLGSAIDGAATLYRGVWPTCFVAPFASPHLRRLRLGAETIPAELGRGQGSRAANLSRELDTIQ